MVVVDPVPTFAAIIPDRKDGIYLLPSTTQFETSGSVTASNRSLQWRDRVFKPWFEAKVDHEIMYLFAKKFGFDKEHVQAHRGQEQRAGGRGHHPRIQQGHVDHRLYRPVAGAAEGAHGQPAKFRPDHAEGQGRAGRRRLLRSAVAVLGHRRDEASRHADALRHLQVGGGGRSHLPRPLRRRAQRHQHPGRGLLFEGFGDQGRLSRIHHGHAEEARLGQGSHRPTSVRRSRKWRP